MEKKEVNEALKKYYIIAPTVFLGLGIIGGVVAMVLMNEMSYVFFAICTAIGAVTAVALMFPLYLKPKRMWENLCMKCNGNEKTEVTGDAVLGKQTIKNALYEVHLVTHTCRNCGTSYTCHEYQKQ